MPRGLSSRGLAGCRHSRMVRRQGIEPRTAGLRVRLSAIELAAPALAVVPSPLIPQRRLACNVTASAHFPVPQPADVAVASAAHGPPSAEKSIAPRAAEFGAIAVPAHRTAVNVQEAGLRTAGALRVRALHVALFHHAHDTGADEENRTPVLSLEDCCSAIELHPHGGPRR